MGDDIPICDLCGIASTPGGDPRYPDAETVCPGCADAPLEVDGLMGPTRNDGAPPHGGTTR